MSAQPTNTKSPFSSRRLTPTRDSVTTIRADGSRAFLYPADAHGRFTTARRLSAYLLIAIYLLLPWIPVGGHPAVFLDIASRRFHFFGYTLAAQDAWLLFFGVSGLGFALFFITALFGRFLVPLASLGVVLLHPFAFGVHLAEPELRGGIALFRLQAHGLNIYLLCGTYPP